MKNIIKIFVAGVTALTLTTGAGFAFSNNANENAADGQAKARANCSATITKQNGNGQTGENTGNNDHDPKTLNTAVTNCDKFWPQGNSD